MTRIPPAATGSSSSIHQGAAPSDPAPCTTQPITPPQGIHPDAFFFAPATLTRADFRRYFLDEPCDGRGASIPTTTTEAS